MAKRKAIADGLLERIAQVLRKHLSQETIVDVSPSGIRNNLHVLVISRDLDDKTEQQKQEYLWSILEDGGLKKPELQRISLILPLSVDELKR